MAVKTFTTSEILTASDTNTYLANAGLVYITSTTIGSAVSSVTVSNCFSSTYDNYKITISGGAGTGSAGLKMTLGAAATNYYLTLPYTTWGGTQALANVNNGTGWDFAGSTCTDFLFMDIDVFAPNLAKHTQCAGLFVREDLTAPVAGVHKTATAYTSFTLTPTAGTVTGGTLTVYGYRQA